MIEEIYSRIKQSKRSNELIILVINSLLKRERERERARERERESLYRLQIGLDCWIIFSALIND